MTTITSTPATLATSGFYGSFSGHAFFGSGYGVYNVIDLTGTNVSFKNTGYIFGYYDAVVVYGSGGRVTNTGTLGSGGGGAGVFFASTASNGLLTNQGSILGALGGTGVLLRGSGDTFVNSGLVNKPTGIGAYTSAPADGVQVYGLNDIVTNQSTGTIQGYRVGIGLKGSNENVINAGGLITQFVYGPTGLSHFGIYGSGGTITNLAGGRITAPSSNGVGIDLTFATSPSAGTVINAGTITGGSGLAVKEKAGFANRVVIDAGAVFNGNVDGGNTSVGATISTLELGAGAGTLGSVFNSAKYFDFQAFQVDAGSTWTLTGTNSIASGETLTNLGTLNSSGALINAGVVLLNGGSLQISTLSGAGVITFGAATGDILALSSAASTVETINNMTIGQTIEITGQTVTSANVIGGTTLSLTLAAGGPLNIKLGASAGANFFHHSTVGGNSFITESGTPCYLAGTRIRTDRGEILVEELQIGDRVITLDGTAKPIKWIGRRAYSSAFAAGNRDVIPILIRSGALGTNVPVRDLYVSPLHAMFFGDVLVQAEQLVNGVSVVRCPEIDPIRYFHIELENHDVIFAEGAPAETFVDCDSRGMFHNAPEFVDLYPGEHPQAWKFCFPRVESGSVLERIRRDIDARAGLTNSTPGALKGNLDGLDGTTITGWAFDSAHPDTPVELEILDGNGVIARLTADRFRSDLETAGVGDGRRGFELNLARPLSPHARHEIRVRRVADRRELANSPLTIESYDSRTLVTDAHCAISSAIETAREDGTLDGMLDALLYGIDQVRRLHASQCNQPGDDRLLGLASSHRQRPRRALFIDTKLPRVGQDAILADIESLRAQEWEVEFVASAELAGADDAVAALIEIGLTCHRAPLVASVEEVLRRKRGMFDLVCLRDEANADAYAALARTWQARARVVYGAVGDVLAAARAA